MAINSNFTKLANTMWRLKNPNSQAGTMLIELPADVGRAYSGYKRGGIIEASEKFRKEVMSAAVWLFGIPVFNKIGNVLCEKLLKIPMDIDYSNSKDGKDAIENSLKYLAGQFDGEGFDVSELKKYVGKFDIKDVAKTTKKIKGAKQIISIASLILNCVLMGIVLPKINQKMTAKKLKENKKEETQTTLKAPTMEEYQKQTANNNKEISFKGVNIADWITYGITNNNTFRLVSTDAPMIVGRCATARNKYEALEIGIMDTLAIYFYNFCLPHIEKSLKKVSNIPEVNPKVAEYISNLDSKTIQEAIEKLSQEGIENTTENLLGQAAKDDIYKHATFGKYSKINRFVKDNELRDIDKTVENLLKHIKSKNIIQDGVVDNEALKKLIKSLNIKGSAFYGIGTVASFLGLGILIPKIAYFITKKVTGKDGFIGIEKTDDKK